MANTQIADIYNPLTFSRRVQLMQTELNAFNAAGVSVLDGLIRNQAAQGGNIGEMPQFNGITTSEPNIGTDDPSDVAVPDKIAKATQVYRLNAANNAWNTMNLARDLALEDPLGAITNRVAHYWATHEQSLVINSAAGVLADNVANDGGDMVETVYDDIVTPLDANKISGSAVVDAVQTLGDHKTNIVAIAMHSKPHADLQKLGLLVDNFDPQSGAVRYQTYLGYRVIVDDSLPVTAGTNSPKYTSILFGNGAFGYAPVMPVIPSELDSTPLAGNGAGMETLVSRNHSIYHPYGFQCQGGAWADPGGGTYAELATATTWQRVIPRKNIALAFLETN